MLFLIFFLFLLVLILFSLLSLYGFWQWFGSFSFRDFLTPYECGFDSCSISRFPFSLRFFLIIIIFIILDVEMCFLMQLPYEFSSYFLGKRFWYLLFVLLLFLGVLEEWRRGLLSWKL